MFALLFCRFFFLCFLQIFFFQADAFESEIEQILANKKKKLDKDKQDRLDSLKDLLERHRFHVRKLETLLRMLDNLTIDVDQVSLYHVIPILTY